MCTFDSRFSSFCPLGKQRGLCKIYGDRSTSSPGPSATFYLLIGTIIGRRRETRMLSESWLWSRQTAQLCLNRDRRGSVTSCSTSVDQFSCLHGMFFAFMLSVFSLINDQLVVVVQIILKEIIPFGKYIFYFLSESEMRRLISLSCPC